MELGMKGKKVLVTGGTRGIGRAIVQAVVEEGASVVMCGRDAQRVSDTIAEFRRQGFAVSGAALDIADGGALKAWIGQAADQMGGIDVVVANPSAFGMGVTDQDWQVGYAVDLMGGVRTIESAEPYLEAAARASGDAAVLIVSSAAIAEADRESAYCAYKAALIHYAKGAARRLAAKHVRVNTVSPGTIYCEDGFWGNVKRNLPAMYEDYLGRNPLGRMGRPEEVAKAAAFLCSPAASFVTGTNVLVDGGITGRVNY